MKDSIEKLLHKPYEVQMVKLADRITNLGIPPKHWDSENQRNIKKSKFYFYLVLEILIFI